VNTRDVASFKSANYKLNLGDPMRHLRTELDRGSPRSLSEMARTYDHLPQSDLRRVELHEKTDNPKLWLLKTAAAILAEYLDIEGDTVALKEGLTARALHFGGQPIHPFIPKGQSARDKAHATFGDPFNPLTGRFSVNIRDIGDLTELRESMQAHGWVKEFPAIQDERGITLVGNRRLAVARELHIEPVIQTIVIGDGDAADARRLRLAVVSNTGGKGFTPTDRKRLAEYLKLERGWAQQAIAEALSVGQATVSRDLEELSTVNNSPNQKKGPGRPRKSAKTDAARTFIREHKKKTGKIPGALTITRITGISRVPAEKALAEARMTEGNEGDELRSWLLQRIAEASTPMLRAEAETLLRDFRTFLDNQY
jgi:hypothetical protein